MIKARIQAELTQQAVADKLDRPQSFVAKYEGGERRLDFIELIDIAAILKIEISEIAAKFVNDCDIND
ncbi:MAG: helix-turn-helix transcriptional regulator [Methylococcales bacterium]